MPIKLLLPHFFQVKKMIKKLTFSAVLLTMFVLTSSFANAGYFSENSHIGDNIEYLKNSITKNTDTSEDVSDPAPVVISASKIKVTKTDPKFNPVATLMVVASAYSSTPHQTDDTPFITANGEYVYWGGVAANIIDTNGRNIPFGTKIMIPDLFGDQIFTINDRMNRRYKNNLDVWFPYTADAREFGRKTIKIVIVAKN